MIAALERGLREFGVSSSASRETTRQHDGARRARAGIGARSSDVEAALLTPDGYLSNLVAAQGLADAIGTVLVDRECHVSVRDALAATGRGPLEYPLADAAAAGVLARELGGDPFAIFTDGVFPVLGKFAPLRELLALLPDDGVMVVDDCHGIGVLGARGRGSVELAGLSGPAHRDHGHAFEGARMFRRVRGRIGGVRSSARASARTPTSARPRFLPPSHAPFPAALRIVEEEPERRERLERLGEPPRASSRSSTARRAGALPRAQLCHEPPSRYGVGPTDPARGRSVGSAGALSRWAGQLLSHRRCARITRASRCRCLNGTLGLKVLR